MTRRFKRTKTAAFRIIGFLSMFLTVYASSAQISSDMNPHIKTDDPTETILYTALKKGFVSIKADVHLVDGELKTMGDQSFENLYLRPLSDRIQENNGSIYQDYSGLFYLFIQLIGDEKRSLNALEKTLEAYRGMIAGFKWNKQSNPVKVILINASSELASEIMNKESSLISLEGDYSNLDEPVRYTKMPVVALNYDNLDRNSLSKTAKRLHRKGKKLRLYNVPHDRALWESLMASGTDFINSRRTQAFISKVD